MALAFVNKMQTIILSFCHFVIDMNRIVLETACHSQVLDKVFSFVVKDVFI